MAEHKGPHAGSTAAAKPLGGLAAGKISNIFVHLRKIALHPLLVRRQYDDARVLGMARLACSKYSSPVWACTSRLWVCCVHQLFMPGTGYRVADYRPHCHPAGPCMLPALLQRQLELGKGDAPPPSAAGSSALVPGVRVALCSAWKRCRSCAQLVSCQVKLDAASARQLPSCPSPSLNTGLLCTRQRECAPVCAQADLWGCQPGQGEGGAGQLQRPRPARACLPARVGLAAVPPARGRHAAVRQVPGAARRLCGAGHARAVLWCTCLLVPPLRSLSLLHLASLRLLSVNVPAPAHADTGDLVAVSYVASTQPLQRGLGTIWSAHRIASCCTSVHACHTARWLLAFNQRSTLTGDYTDKPAQIWDLVKAGPG